MKHATVLLLVAACFSLTACATDSDARSTSATIVEPSAESRDELQRVVSAAVRRDTVLLAEDALLRDSVLIIEPARLRDASGALIADRDPRAVVRFRLILQDQRCLLVREDTGERFLLSHTRCRAQQ